MSNFNDGSGEVLFEQGVSWWRMWLRRNKFTLLLLTILTLLVAMPIIDVCGGKFQILMSLEKYVIPLLFTGIMIAAVYAVSQNRKMLILAAVTGMFALPMQWADVIFNYQALMVLRLVMIIVFLTLVFASILWAVLTSMVVDRDILAGAVCVFLLIGLTGGCCYTLVEILDDGSIQYSAAVVGETGQPVKFAMMSISDNFDNMVYFSFVCMTTLGFGDIVPVSTTAKTLAYLQAILGQFYLAVLVARLVGMHLAGGVLKHHQD